MVRKAWDYEKSVPGAQIAPTAWGNLQLEVSLNVAIALTVPPGVLGNLIKSFDRRKYLSQSIFRQQMFLKRCDSSSQSLNAINHRISRPEVFCQKDVLRDFAKFTGKHLCQSLFLIKLPQTWNFFKKRLWHKCLL